MVHLHMRSSYSILESPIRLENMILHQKQLGYNHVCLTDHNVMYGTMEFYQLCKKHNVHAIIGLEVDSIYNEEPFHFILLAKNDTGLQNLYKLSSIIKENVSFDEVIKYAKDCVVLTSSDGKDTFSFMIELNLYKLSSIIKENVSFPSLEVSTTQSLAYFITSSKDTFSFMIELNLYKFCRPVSFFARRIK